VAERLRRLMAPLCLPAILFLVGSASGTSHAVGPESPATHAALSELDVDGFYEPYLSIGREIPQFAGAYLDHETQATLVVLVTDGSVETAERVRSAFLALGSPYEAYGGHAVEAVQAEYSFVELHEWRPELRSMLALPWVTSAGIDITANRLSLGVSDLDRYGEAAERELRERGIPPEMVLVEEMSGMFSLPGTSSWGLIVTLVVAAVVGIGVLVAAIRLRRHRRPDAELSRAIDQDS
jgi:hypothetical protein